MRYPKAAIVFASLLLCILAGPWRAAQGRSGLHARTPAAVDPSRWNRVLETIRRILDGTHGQRNGGDDPERERLFDALGRELASISRTMIASGALAAPPPPWPPKLIRYHRALNEGRAVLPELSEKVAASLEECTSYPLPPSRKELFMNDGFPCLTMLPEHYSPSSAWKMLVTLHGAGETPGDEFERWRKACDEQGIILACIGSRTSRWWDDAHRRIISGYLAFLRRRYHVAADGIFLGGASNGANGALAYACRTPHLPAGLVLRSCYPPPMSASLCAAIPFFIVHGAKDTIFPPSHIERFVDALRSEGADVSFQLIEGAPHGAFPEWCPRACEWMAMHRRGPAPSTLYVAATGKRGEPLRSWWLEVTPESEGGFVVKGIREGNEFSIETGGPCSIRVLLSLKDYDPWKRVRIRVNSRLVFDDYLPPDPVLMVRWYAAVRDAQRPVCAILTLRGHGRKE